MFQLQPRTASSSDGSGQSVRVERARQTTGLVAGPLLAALAWALLGGLPAEQRALSAVLLLVVTYWVTEALALPVTALLGLTLCVLAGVAPAAEVFGAFSSSTIFLFIGSFIIARAMTLHGLDRRFSFFVLSLPGVARSTHRIVIAFGAVAALLSAVISNTAAVAMLFPIALGVMGTLTGLIDKDDDEVEGGTAAPSAAVPAGPSVHGTRLRLGTALMLMTAYGASIGGLLTPIGSPPNLIGRRFIADLAGVEISFLDWMVMAFPVVAVMFVLLSVVLLVLNRPEVRHLEGAEEYVRTQRAQLGPFSRAERTTLTAFAIAVTLWVLPGVVGLVLGEDAALSGLLRARLDEGAVALLAAVTLFLLPLDWRERRFTLEWAQAVRIDWGTILLFGCGIVLGTLLSSTGLADRVGTGVAEMTGVTSVLALTVFAAVAAVLLSEAASNTASVGIIVPIVIPVAIAAGVDPLVPAMAAVFGASYGFMLPVSTPPNAIVYGSGMVPITRMIRSGAVFDLLGAIVIVTGISVLVGTLGLLG
jgi:solute carrier family 13 (sodium-dependent dicarboxylate transporter), member 2/3/5